jgi:hypothetical protein
MGDLSVAVFILDDCFMDPATTQLMEGLLNG